MYIDWKRCHFKQQQQKQQKSKTIFTRWQQLFSCTCHLHFCCKDLKRQELNWNTIKKFTIIIVTEEVFFLARSIHNWQLFAAPRICASRIICGWCAHTLNLCSYHKFVKKRRWKNPKSLCNLTQIFWSN